MLSCRKSNANVWNNNLETQDFRTASRVQPTFSRRFEKSTRPTDTKNARAPFATPGRPTQNNSQPPRKRGGATCDARMTDAKQQSTARKRRGATCDARTTDAMPRTGQYKTTNRPSPRHICRRPTRPTDCAVPAPGVMNGAPTGYAANRPTQNNIRPPRKRTGAICDARTTTAMPRTDRNKTANRPPQNNSRPLANARAPLVTPG